MAIVQKSLLGNPSRVPTAPFQSPRRNYPVSEAIAGLFSATGEGGSIRPSDFQRGTDPTNLSYLNLLLFTQDAPIVLWGETSYDAAFFGTTSLPGFDFVEPGISLVSQLSGGTDMTQADSAAYKQQASVALASAGITVPGYAARLTPRIRNLVTTSGGSTQADFNAFVVFHAESASAFGWGGQQGTASFGAVLLRSSDYTPAIRAAGNVVVSGSVTYYVVGLYEAVLVPVP